MAFSQASCASPVCLATEWSFFETVYIKREDWDRINPERPYPEGIANIIIAKHRNGPQGQRNLRFRQEITRFENCPVEAEIEQAFDLVSHGVEAGKRFTSL
jgi:hypothetical protein